MILRTLQDDSRASYVMSRQIGRGLILCSTWHQEFDITLKALQGSRKRVGSNFRKMNVYIVRANVSTKWKKPRDDWFWRTRKVESHQLTLVFLEKLCQAAYPLVFDPITLIHNELRRDISSSKLNITLFLFYDLGSRQMAYLARKVLSPIHVAAYPYTSPSLRRLWCDSLESTPMIDGILCDRLFFENMTVFLSVLTG